MSEAQVDVFDYLGPALREIREIHGLRQYQAAIRTWLVMTIAAHRKAEVGSARAAYHPEECQHPRTSSHGARRTIRY